MSEERKCPKCGLVSGDDWSQCEGLCPMEGSPYKAMTVRELIAFLSEHDLDLPVTASFYASGSTGFIPLRENCFEIEADVSPDSLNINVEVN